MKKMCFGVDIGGTTIKIGLFDTDGIPLSKWEIPTNRDDNGKNILYDIKMSLFDRLHQDGLSAEDILGIGLGVPGPVTNDGTVMGCVNLGWGIMHVSDELKKLTGFPVRAANDANIAALGEQWRGAGKSYRDLVLITLGTGVGGGIVTDGQIVCGANGAGGEIGHMHVVYDETEPCNCGNTGCLEQAASATGLVRYANHLLNERVDPSALRNIDDLTAKDIFACGDRGDALALAAIDRTASILGIAMANIGCILNPEVFLLGGGMAKAGGLLITKVQESYRANVFPAARSTPILPAKLGNDAGIYGGARLITM